MTPGRGAGSGVRTTPAPAHPPRLTFLTFTRNDGGEMLPTLELLRPLVQEVVVVDSSGPAERDRLLRTLRPPTERLVPAVALGDADLLRPYGLHLCTGEWVLSLDADEMPSRGLLETLPHVGGAAGYIIPRFEIALGAYRPQLRLFRRDRATYDGPSYRFPTIQGPVVTLAREQCILHRAPFGAYLATSDRRRRYRLVEWLERPLSQKVAWEILARPSRAGFRPLPGVQWLFDRPFQPLSAPARRLAFAVEAVYDLLLTAQPRMALFRWRYNREREVDWRGLGEEDRRRYCRMAQAVASAGGLTHYLDLYRPEYVEWLTRTLPETAGGPPLLAELVRVRFETGRPWDGRTALQTHALISSAGERTD
jgi:hypothetical protein